MKRVIIILTITISVGFIFYLIVKNSDSTVEKIKKRRRCHVHAEISSLKINGSIIKLYRDSEADNTIKYYDYTRKDTLESDMFVLDQNGVFYELNTGDLIRKDTGGLKIEISRSGKILSYELNYGCMN